ncbi:copper-binding protein [Polaromonas sp. AER18D-145]|uniref:copper-binding protein n=1 Tax=Polaromonas sp. AER18D-145 TaxID=1977060 RepID=UPI000BBCE7FE|nr:copper-binding protein [Polaromonas sp. AER18D-145]
MKSSVRIFLTTALLSVSATGFAIAATDTPSGVQGAIVVPVAVKLTAGEVRKVDLEQGKLTIKHEALENLDMPGMTMVFKAADAKLLMDVKQGDRILFRAEKGEAGFTVVRLEQVK